MLCLAENPCPSRQESGGIVDGLVHGAHVRLGLFERCVDALDHFVDFAHPFQLGLQARISRFVRVVAIFCSRGLGCRSIVAWGVFLRGCAALGAREEVFFFIVLQAQARYVGCVCVP